MPSTRKKCNFCHAELTVSDEAPVVECPVCNGINGYGFNRSNQTDKHSRVVPNSQVRNQQSFSAAPDQRQAPLHAILGGTIQPGSLHFVDTNSLLQQLPPQTLPEFSPPKTNTQVSPSSQASVRMLTTNYTGFQKLSLVSSSIQSSLPPVKTKTSFQLPSQTSSPPIPENIANNYFQQPQQTSSPRASYTNISYPTPFQTSSPTLQAQTVSTPSPQGSPRPSYNNTPYQQPFQISSPPTLERTNNLYERPQDISSPQRSPRPTDINSFYQQPSQTVSPLIPEKNNNISQPIQQTSSPKWSPHPAYGRTSYQKPLISSQPLIQEKSDNFTQLPQQTLSPQGSSHVTNSNTFYHKPLQSPSPLIQEKPDSFSQLPQQTPSPQGSPRSSISNTSFSQALPSSPPLESQHQPQTSSPQGSSPRPSRFNSLFKSQAAQTPTPQGSPPQSQNLDQKQRPLLLSSQVPSSLSREGNNNYNKQALQTTPQITKPTVQPLLQAPRLPINNNGHIYQQSVQGSKPVSSSIMSTAPLTDEQQVRHGTNQGANGKIPTSDSQSADHQNSRSTQGFRGNLTGGTTNYVNEDRPDTGDDHNYTKRRLEELRGQLQQQA